VQVDWQKKVVQVFRGDDLLKQTKHFVTADRQNDIQNQDIEQLTDANKLIVYKNILGVLQKLSGSAGRVIEMLDTTVGMLDLQPSESQQETIKAFGPQNFTSDTYSTASSQYMITLKENIHKINELTTTKHSAPPVLYSYTTTNTVLSEIVSALTGIVSHRSDFSLSIEDLFSFPLLYRKLHASCDSLCIKTQRLWTLIKVFFVLRCVETCLSDIPYTGVPLFDRRFISGQIMASRGL